MFFVVALGADGVFTATLSTLLADIIPVTSALIGAGLLLAGQRLISVILSFVSGPIVDRLKAHRAARAVRLWPSQRASLAIAIGHVYAGAVVLIFARVAVRDRRADRRRASNRPTGSARSRPTRPGRTAGSRPAPSSASSGWNGPAIPMTYAGSAARHSRRSSGSRLSRSSSAASARVTGRFCRNASRSSVFDRGARRRERALDARRQIADQALVDARAGGRRTASPSRRAAAHRPGALSVDRRNRTQPRREIGQRDAPRRGRSARRHQHEGFLLRIRLSRWNSARSSRSRGRVLDHQRAGRERAGRLVSPSDAGRDAARARDLGPDRRQMALARALRADERERAVGPVRPALDQASAASFGAPVRKSSRAKLSACGKASAN